MIKLRDYQADDYEAVARNANNPAVVAFLRTVIPSPYTEDDARWWVSEGSKLPGTFNQAIEYEGRYAGNIGAVFDANNTEAEIGIWLGQDFWGKGLGTEAVMIFSENIFAKFGTPRLIAHIAVEHAASIGLFEKCGYKCLGRGTNAIEVHAGLHNCLIYAKQA